MSAFEVWNVIRRRWWVIAVMAVVAAVSALLYSLAQPPMYRAHAEAIVLPSRDDYGLSMFLEARMRTFRSVLLSFPKTESDIPDDLADRIHVQIVTEEARIVIEVDDRDPQQAAHWAEVLVQRLQEWVDKNAPVGIDRLYVRSLAPVQVPTAPSSPRYKVNTLAGAVLGAILGLPLAFLWEFYDDTLGDAARAAARLGIAVWPALPAFPLDEVSPLRDPTGEVAAAFHRLHTHLRLAGASGEGSAWRILAVTGVPRGELPPALLADLGVAMAQEGNQVLLVDADLGRPALHKLLNLPATPGLGDFLASPGENPTPAQTQQDRLALLPAGEPLPPAAQAMALHRTVRALPALVGAAEAVLLRLPAPLAVPESLLLAAQADAVLLVARADRDRGRDVRRVLEALRRAQARVLGLALWRERSPR